MQNRSNNSARVVRAFVRFAAGAAVLVTLSAVVFAGEPSAGDIKVDPVRLPVTLSNGNTYTAASAPPPPARPLAAAEG